MEKQLDLYNRFGVCNPPIIEVVEDKFVVSSKDIRCVGDILEEAMINFLIEDSINV
jgi:hypothetical protein